MKKSFLLYIIIQFSVLGVFSQSKRFNYVKTTVFLSPDTSEFIYGISYSDAAGRPLQSVMPKASPSGNDIVKTFEYDSLGRAVKSRLPFTNPTKNGGFINDAEQVQQTFWQNQNIQGADIPYAQVEYDNSPYNRVVKQSIPGEDINQIAVSSDFEPAGGIELWETNNSGQSVKNGIYPENSLMKFTIKDAEGKLTFIYKNKSGQVILKEKANTKTRYVYDTYGQLRYVFSPEAVAGINRTSYNKNDTLIKNLCYYYEYNTKHQLVTKQLPGKELVYLRYDDKYRLRLTQDGNRRTDSLWMFINYDPFGRTISTGITKIEDTENIPDTINPDTEDPASSFLTYQYYDNYDFIEDQNLFFDSAQAYHQKFDRIKGKPTGSKVRVMTDDNEVWLTSAVYYDKYGRTVQAISKNNVGGYDIVSNKYDFSGKLLISKQKHTDYTQNTKFLVYLYDYDTMGRLLKIRLSQSEDTSNAIIINEMVYNELGQIKQKKIHSENGTDFLQTEDFGYNINGALININDPDNLGNDLFGMNLFYDYDDGKISALQWNSKNLNQTKKYTYEYDELNRLTHAVYTPENRYDVNIEYDLNGNITRLSRKGEILNHTTENGLPTIIKSFGTLDSLTYSYFGNKLIKVKDEINEINTQLNNDFKDIEISTDEYTYDANGNMISDINKGISNISYNLLNQPAEVDFGTQKTVYTYTATGMKLKTRTYENGNLKNTTEYSGAFVYENNTLSYINIPGGRIVNCQSSIVNYEYYLTDRLGNIRVTFGKDTAGNAEILQEDHYYPFGMRMSGQHYSNTELINKYLYNGKEQQEQTLYYDYGFRQMDAQLGRWHVVDALAENYFSESPYSYAGNDPVNKYDVMGLQYYWKKEEWQTENHFSGGGMNNFSNFGYNMMRSFLRSGWDTPIFSSSSQMLEYMDNHGYTSYNSQTGFGYGGQSRKTFSPKLKGWGRNSAGHRSLKQKIKRFFNLDNWTFWDTETVWVWDDAQTDNFTSTFPDGGDPPDGSYKANLATSKDPIYDIFYAIHMAVKTQRGIKNLYDIVQKNNYSNSNMIPSYSKRVSRKGFDYKVRVEVGWRYAEKHKFGYTWHYFDIYKVGFGYLDKVKNYPTKNKWLWDDGFAFGFYMIGYENNYLITIGANSHEGYLNLKQLFFDIYYLINE